MPLMREIDVLRLQDIVNDFKRSIYLIDAAEDSLEELSPCEVVNKSHFFTMLFKANCNAFINSICHLVELENEEIDDNI